jgi:hypothetical protein
MAFETRPVNRVGTRRVKWLHRGLALMNYTLMHALICNRKSVSEPGICSQILMLKYLMLILLGISAALRVNSLKYKSL